MTVDDRLLVVSHPSVVTANQAVYLRLRELGWRLLIVVPSRWRHEYEPAAFRPRPLGGLEDCLLPIRVAFTGRPQRHFYLTRPASVVRRFGPTVALLEEESFSAAAFQWAAALRRQGTPYAVQAAENLDRRLPWPASSFRHRTLGPCALVVARSPAAGDLARHWGARGKVEVLPHAVPRWDRVGRRETDEPFTVGYAGRLVPEKGVSDLVEAMRRLGGARRLLLVGDGPLRADLERASIPGCDVRVVSDLGHEEMPRAYARMDVLVLPSRTTPRWAEQFGRVLVEALWCEVPVLGSDSGEIPWVIEVTNGGLTFPEGSADALAEALAVLRDRPEEARAMALRGRRAVERLFSTEAVSHALDDALRSVARSPRGSDDRSREHD